jgi:hypothetical protein
MCESTDLFHLTTHPEDEEYAQQIITAKHNAFIVKTFSFTQLSCNMFLTSQPLSKISTKMYNGR